MLAPEDYHFENPVLGEKEVSSLSPTYADGTINPTQDSHPLSESLPESLSEGDYIDDTPAPDGGYVNFPIHFPDPSLMICYFDKSIQDGQVTLNPWQHEDLVKLGSAKPTSQEPHKFCLVGSNGSGKDKFIIAPFATWFIFSKVKSLVIITTASGTQLTSQTEPYIKDLCEKINAYFGVTMFKIRQRYIKCLQTGSEIRMFATDEAGKAEGYHPKEPNAEMAIIVNEGKSVSEEIHRALRRCSGFNYWLEISSSGEPKGYFYTAATTWKNCRYVTSYDCKQISPDEIEEDKQLDGEHSAFFRSKHLSQFTSIGGNNVIPIELVQDLLKNPPTYVIKDWPIRIGLDLAAGGDETVVCITRGNKVLKESWFRETDTVAAARIIARILTDEKIPKTHAHIYGDDGGIGRGIIDNLVDQKWNINRVMNQWAALGNKKQYGNRGAENWYRCKRIIEERMFDLTGLTTKTHEQLYSRHYKQSLTGGRIFLELKSEAKAHGRPSPDRADAFILALTGLTVEDFISASGKVVEKKKDDNKPAPKRFSNLQDLREHYEDVHTFKHWNETNERKFRRRTVGQLIKDL